ncbi:MAG TPA: endolytic transglycosylase MltG [Longimicrobiales bacterium]|nr:endolytic transglycosylase MltG [Longimicrobiales bacterium]
MSRGIRGLLLVLGSTATIVGCGRAPQGPPVQVTVPRGATFQDVVDTLETQGLVGSATAFSLYARLRGDDRRIRAGRYEFRPGTSWNAILADLRAGRVITEPVTIPEGFTLDLMAPRLADITGLDANSVAVVLHDTVRAEDLAVPGPGLEGYLFPDTYRFAPGASLDTVLHTMVERYRAFWTGARRRDLKALGMNEREAVTLASIVQAEAREVEEMPLISGVYHNRLERGYPLQADPTVLYALGGPRERLLYAAMDSVADDPYNTYTHPGLPPGPIGAPGEDALEAALHPAETDFLYFVARPDGRHIFSRTLTEHNRAVARARRAWDSVRAGDTTSPPTGGRPPP